MARIVIDAGHGGSDPGATYEGRREKDDTLRLALAVGELLENRGNEVIFTRTDDIYETPFQKATEGNLADADFFVSIHRNSSPQPNQYEGVETLVYDDSGIKADMARRINEELERVGFANLGVQERPGLVVLRRTKMPAALVEVGFINSDEDNRIFDQQFDNIARAIAQGVQNTLDAAEGQSGTGFNPSGSNPSGSNPSANNPSGSSPSDSSPSGNSQPGNPAGAQNPLNVSSAADTEFDEDSAEDEMENYRGEEEMPFYRVQTGVFRRQENAQEQLYQLRQQGFPAYIINEDGYYKVQVGAFEKLDNAIRMEAVLRRNGYSTFLTTEREG